MAHKWMINKTVPRQVNENRAWVADTLVPYAYITIYRTIARVIRRSAAELIAEILIIHPPSDIGRG